MKISDFVPSTLKKISKTEDLSEADRERIKTYGRKWCDRFANPQPVEDEVVVSAIEKFYSDVLKEKRPEIVWLDSPLAVFLTKVVIESVYGQAQRHSDFTTWVSIQSDGPMDRDQEKELSDELLGAIYKLLIVEELEPVNYKGLVEEELTNLRWYSKGIPKNVVHSVRGTLKDLFSHSEDQKRQSISLINTLEDSSVNNFLFSPDFDADFILLDGIYFSDVGKDLIALEFFTREKNFYSSGKFMEISSKLARSVECMVPMDLPSPNEQVCLVSRKPNHVQINEDDQLHNDDGPSLTFDDDFEVFALNGETIPSRFMQSPEDIRLSDIEQETDSDVRLYLMRQYGVQKYLQETEAEIVDRTDDAVLFCKKEYDREPLLFVKLLGPSGEQGMGSRDEYFLRVPPQITSANEAVAWSFQKEIDEYEPTTET